MQLIPFNQALVRQEEGWHPSPNSRPVRLNNPGDLEYHDWMADNKYGGVKEPAPAHGTARFARFPTLRRGWLAQVDLLIRVYSGLTVRAALLKYAPDGENDTSLYEADVCLWTGLLPGHILTSADFVIPDGV